MLKHKYIDVICIVITLLTLLITVAFMNGSRLGIETLLSEESSDEMFTQNDLDDDWNVSGATKISLSDNGSTVSGNGAYVNDGDVYIVYAGKYLLTGELSDGSVVIQADGDDKIHLMMNDVSIHCEDSAAIRIEQAGKVFLTLKEGSENTLSSGESYSENDVSNGIDGTIFSRDDLTINGAGSLKVTAEYQHGIVCNDDLVITGGTLESTAAQDALHANDSVRIKDADITLTAGDDGITVSNDDETAFIYVESGNISIPSCYEGMEAISITIAGGTLDIKPTDDGLNANGYSGNSVINISGGEINITVENGRDSDGIDSNRDIYISGGKVLVSVSDSGGSCAIDCGSENGGKCEISGGTVLACGSSGMAEGFDEASTQGFLMQTVSAAAGTDVTVKDLDGNELINETVPCSFSSVLVSTPDMNIGDKYTLSVGDNETEMTVDNTSPESGGFGGGRMQGGRGFGGQITNGTDGTDGGFTPPDMPDGMQGETPPEMSDGEMPEGMQGETPPEMSDGEMPEGMQGETPPEMPDGEMPEDMPQDGMQDNEQESVPQDTPQENSSTDTPQTDDTDSSSSQSEFQQFDRAFGQRQDKGNMGNMGGMNGNMTEQQQDTASQAEEAEPITAEELIMFGASVVILILGCIIVKCYKRRG